MKWIKKRKQKEQIEEKAEEKNHFVNNIVEKDLETQKTDKVVSTPSFLKKAADKPKITMEETPKISDSSIIWEDPISESSTAEQPQPTSQPIYDSAEPSSSDSEEGFDDAQKDALKNEMKDFLEEMKKQMRG